MNGVAIRFTLGKQTKDGGEPISKNSLLFYNSALGAVAVGLFMLMVRCRRISFFLRGAPNFPLKQVLPGELRASIDFHLWSDRAFIALFVSAAAAGYGRVVYLQKHE
jgi:phosphotransferase system  glucose/maltose/N-acetylglucosamine-specific IIC component